MSTGARVRSLAIRNFHRKMLAMAAKALDQVPTSRRDVTSVTVPLTPEAYERCRVRIGQLRREVLALSEACADGDAPLTVYQLELALFPVSKELDR